MNPAEMAVLAANATFYRAFAEGNVEAMESQWAREAPVACVHPGWAPLLGRQRVMAGWRGLFDSGTAKVSFDGASAHVLGDAAYVVCREIMGDTMLAATNFFVLERGAWKLVHHQATHVGRRRAAVSPGKASRLN